MLQVTDLINPPLYVGEDYRPTLSERLGRWGARHLIIRRIVSLLALMMGSAYLAWRIQYTRGEVSGFLFYSLLIAEFFGFISFALFLHDSWLTNPPKLMPAADFSVDILIPTYDEPIEVVEPTIYAASIARGRKSVYLLDDGKREWGEELCKKYGATYVTRNDNRFAKAGNINAALGRLTSELILVLDADHVCDPAILERMTGYFVDPKLAVLQTAHDFRNHDSAQHQSSGANEQSLFFDVLLTGRNRTNSAFWCGSAGVIRRSALLENGGLSTDTVTEDLETTLALQRKGWKALYLPERLIHGLAPQNLAGYLLQRDRWARGTLQILLGKKSPIFGRGFSLGARISYLSNLFYYLNPIQRFVYSYILLATLLFGALPMNGFSWQLSALWAGWNLMAILSSTLLSLGRTTPFEGSKNIWITGDIYVRAFISTLFRKRVAFAVTPKVGIDTGGAEALRLTIVPIFMGIITAAAAVSRIFEIAFSSEDSAFLTDLPFFASALAIFYGGLEVFIIFRATQHLYKRHQVRTHWRYPVKLNAHLNEKPARCIDLHLNGAGFVSETFIAPVGYEIPVKFDIPTSTGELTPVKASLRVTRSELAKGGYHTGGTLNWGCGDCSSATMHHVNITVPFNKELV